MARLAFFGTPQFSLPSLMAMDRFCRAKGHTLDVVVTQSDKPQGRGQHLLPPPVKTQALRLGLTILQPVTLKKNTDEGDVFFSQLSEIKPDLAVVVAYGKIITKRLIQIPPLGFVNVHASLLPRFRGAAPVQRAIEANDKKTGVCLMDIVEKLDEGDVYACENTPIISSDTSGTLFYRLAHLGAHLLEKNLEKLLNGSLVKYPQSHEGILYAPMLEKEEGLLNFLLPGKVLCAQVRAFDPWPASYGFIRGKRIKFFDSFFIHDESMHFSEPGSIMTNKPFLGVKTIDGILYFQSMQIEGKKIMSVKEALLGFPIAIGDRIDAANC